MFRQCRRRRGDEGFTLVEAVISSVIFFVIAGGFIAAYISSMRTHQMSNDFYKATCIARNRIQRARSLEFDSLPLLAEQDASVDEFGNVDNAGRFVRTTTVSNTVPTCTRIAVNVKFPLPGGGVSPQGIEVHTMIAEGM
jgi:Tfp pilus assembly protein PilV